ncbi:22121_t:CDS:2, partial [Gigaspora margarita]
KIVEVVQYKRLKIKLCKIRAHTDIKWNKEAGRLAKEGALCDTSWILIFKQSKHWCCNLKWKESVIEVPPRKFILEVQQRYIEAEWYLSKKNERYRNEAVITLRDLCITILHKMRQERLRARQDYIRGLVRQSTLENFRLILTSTKETFDAIRVLTHVYQKGFYRVIWVERCKKMCEWENSTDIMRAKKRGAEEMQSSQRANLQEPARKKRKLNDKTELQNSNI